MMWSTAPYIVQSILGHNVQLLKQRVEYLHPENVEKVFEEYSIKLDMIYGHP